MQSHSLNRKRRAPGASPATEHAQQDSRNKAQLSNYPQFQDPSQLSDEQFLQWGIPSQHDPALESAEIVHEHNAMPTDYDTFMQHGIDPISQASSNQLIRCNPYQQLAAKTNEHSPNNIDTWQESFGDGTALVPGNTFTTTEDNAELEQRAAAAKHEALSKRPPKHIPPFLLKLSSFVDSEANTDLIRWSQDGNSFIVLDEDEFAKELIPQLFKSDKYTSFVRQLNMYGFHKKVGLTDNSMRASEKKAKNPSEYENAYFRRGRPELLWLIQKARTDNTGKGKKKGKGEEEQDSDNDITRAESGETSTETQQPQARNTELVPVPKTQLQEYQQMRQDVRDLQRTQQHIFSVIAHMRDENAQYRRQIVAQHERHENSINAILTFLATFYNRSLDGNGGFNNNMFTNAIPNSQHQGNVVDVGDDYEPNTNRAPEMRRPIRRPLALLPAPESRPKTSTSQQHLRPDQHHTDHDSRSVDIVQSDCSSVSPAPDIPDQHDDASRNKSDGPDNAEILSMINDVNSNGSSITNPRFDFDSALRHYERANGKTPLTTAERDNVLSIMANHSGTSTQRSGAYVGHSKEQSTYLERFASNQEQLDMLQRLQEEQNAKVQELAGRLQPLSPSGSIPGLLLPAGDDLQDADLADNSSLPEHGDLTDGGKSANNIFSGHLSSDGEGINMDDYLNSDYFSGLDTNLSLGENFVTSAPFGGLTGKQALDLSTAQRSSNSLRPSNKMIGVEEGRGHITGSVSNSSSAPSPQVKDEDEEEAVPDDRVNRSNKKRRIGSTH